MPKVWQRYFARYENVCKKPYVATDSVRRGREAVAGITFNNIKKGEGKKKKIVASER